MGEREEVWEIVFYGDAQTHPVDDFFAQLATSDSESLEFYCRRVRRALLLEGLSDITGCVTPTTEPAIKRISWPAARGFLRYRIYATELADHRIVFLHAATANCWHLGRADLRTASDRLRRLRGEGT